MENPFCHIESLAVSGSQESSSITLNRTRSLSITVEATFGGSIDADLEIDVLYSPDGNRWDTIEYTSWAIPFTVSTTQRRTVLIEVPEHGHIKLNITNGSSADTVTDINIWKTIQSWPEA
jgi:outer membrane usher protein FimD/PapC